MVYKRLNFDEVRWELVMVTKPSSSQQISKTKAKFAEVIASPGSGKTYTLILRLMYLLIRGVPAENILVLSFSNAAVKELLRRIAVFVQSTNKNASARRVTTSPEDLLRITVCTAHSFASSLIKQRNLLNEKKARSLLRKAIRLLQRSYKKRTHPRGVSAAIRGQQFDQLEDLLANQNIMLTLNLLAVAQAANKPISEVTEMAQFASLHPYSEVLRAVGKKYAAIKKKQGVIDFGDMIDLGSQAITKGAPFPYTHILVDEYQDSSPAQVQFIAKMAQLDNRNLMVFGDPYQGIYRFTGAGYTPLCSVLHDVRQYRMPQSHRLTEQTADLASAIAGHAPKQAIQTNRWGELPALALDDSQTAQTRRVVRDIERLLDDGVPARNIVVLARIKSLLDPIEKRLLAHEVLSLRMGQRRERKHVLRVLRLVHTVEQCEKRGKTLQLETLHKALPRVTDVDAKRWKTELAALKKVALSPSLEGRYKQCAKIYLHLLGGVRKCPDLRADVNRWETLCRVYSSAIDMRDAIRQMSRHAVVTGTIHAAKGGEWDHVFIVGVTDGLLPFYKARNDEYAMAEERNLLYVAVTRAREKAWLYHAPSNHSASRHRFKEVSYFVAQPRVRRKLSIRSPRASIPCP